MGVPGKSKGVSSEIDDHIVRSRIFHHVFSESSSKYEKSSAVKLRIRLVALRLRWVSAFNRLNPASLSALTRQTKIKRVIMTSFGGLIHVFIITIRVKIQQEVRMAYLGCGL